MERRRTQYASMPESMNVFIFPAVVSVAAFVGAFVWGGLSALFLVALLAILETTLSFDNAVVNAKDLVKMNEKWQKPVKN